MYELIPVVIELNNIIPNNYFHTAIYKCSFILIYFCEKGTPVWFRSKCKEYESLPSFYILD